MQENKDRQLLEALNSYGSYFCVVTNAFSDSGIFFGGFHLKTGSTGEFGSALIGSLVQAMRENEAAFGIVMWAVLDFIKQQDYKLYTELAELLKTYAKK